MNSPGTIACRVCGAPARFAFRAPVLGRGVAYFGCVDCGYFQTETPYWLSQAYASAINDVDTGILWRNQLNVRRVIVTLGALGRLSGRVVDHAGGYGILVRLLRDAGVDAYWRDKYCQNLLARGFEAPPGRYDLLTAFEVFEHLEHPLDDLRQMLEMAPAVLISTELVEGRDPPPPDWWYLGSEHGQHIGFFRRQTLAWMSERLQCHLATDGRSLHLFSLGPVPARWAVFRSAARVVAPLLRTRLTSRTLSDFSLLRKAR